MDFIFLLDYLLLPIYFFIIYRIAFAFREKNYPPGHPWRPYFIRALTFKLGGAVIIGLIYQYYYGSGDTGYYFTQARFLYSIFSDSPSKWLNLMLHVPNWYDAGYADYISQLPYYYSTSSYTVVTITALILPFGAFCYLTTAVIFASISFTGIWALFRTFAKQYPQLVKQVAYACLFVPSTFVWGSGIFKDTICMFSLGWITYCSFDMLINRRIRLSHIATIIFCSYLIISIKVYIALAFAPALMLWVLFHYVHLIRAPATRLLIKISIPVLLLYGLVFFASRYADELGKYSLDNLIQTSAVTRDYIYRTSGDEGSAYDLGKVDPSPQGMLATAPLAINVSLFRPYLWESKKVIMLISAIESSIFLLSTIFLLFKVGPGSIWKIIRSDLNVQFCLIFTMIFAFSVGISTYNFGTLSRYRIPCLPFYCLAMFLIYAKHQASQLLARGSYAPGKNRRRL